MKREAYCAPARHGAMSAGNNRHASLQGANGTCITITKAHRAVSTSRFAHCDGAFSRQSIAAARAALLKSHKTHDDAIPTTKACAALQAIDTGLRNPCYADQEDQVLARFRSGLSGRMSVSPAAVQCGL